MTVSGDIFKDFWDQNAELLTLSDFKRFKELNEDSSKIMWCIYQVYDYNSKLRNEPLEARLGEVRANYYDVDLDRYSGIVDAYKEVCMTPLQKQFNSWVEEIQSTLEFIKDATWTTSNIDKKVSALKGLAVLFDIAKKLEAEILKEAEGSNNLGAYKETGIEDGTILGFVKHQN